MDSVAWDRTWPARRSRRGRFDLSRPAIETARKAATRFGLSAEFTQMDAAALTYPDDFFDLVIGFGVLHHVIKYPTADVQLFRGMKPAARAVFHETLWDNPLINFARKFTSVPADAGEPLEPIARFDSSVKTFAMCGWRGGISSTCSRDWRNSHLRFGVKN